MNEQEMQAWIEALTAERDTALAQAAFWQGVAQGHQAKAEVLATQVEELSVEEKPTDK